MFSISLQTCSDFVTKPTTRLYKVNPQSRLAPFSVRYRDQSAVPRRSDSLKTGFKGSQSWTIPSSSKELGNQCDCNPWVRPSGNFVTNINGKAYAMNAITPMKPWKTPVLRVIFLVLGAVKPLQAGLKNLSFIHFARWVIVGRDRFPHLSPQQPREDLQYDYLIFFSNFNGTWNQYIDAFSAVLSTGLNAIWRWSEKFPGSVPVTPFKSYINRLQFDTDYYYNAYPRATTNDVKAALRVQDALDDFARTSQTLSPTEFAQAYLEFLVRVQVDLGSTGMAPVGT